MTDREFYLLVKYREVIEKATYTKYDFGEAEDIFGDPVRRQGFLVWLEKHNGGDSKVLGTV